MTSTTTQRTGPVVGRQRRIVLGALAALALPLGACGSEAASGAQVASLGTEPPSSGQAGGDTGTEDSAPGSQASTDPEEAFLDYAQCMRDHGIDMPDPVAAGEPGGAVIIDAGSVESREAGTMTAAEEACMPLLDAVVSEIEIDPEQEAEMREQMLAYAACMREHGVDFPDPTFEGNGAISVQVGGPSDGPLSDEDVEDMNAAIEACGELLGDMGISVAATGSEIP